MKLSKLVGNQAYSQLNKKRKQFWDEKPKNCRRKNISTSPTKLPRVPHVAQIHSSFPTSILFLSLPQDVSYVSLHLPTSSFSSLLLHVLLDIHSHESWPTCMMHIQKIDNTYTTYSDCKKRKQEIKEIEEMNSEARRPCMNN